MEDESEAIRAGLLREHAGGVRIAWILGLLRHHIIM